MAKTRRGTRKRGGRRPKEPAERIPPQIGDRVVVGGCHDNYRPILVRIEYHGLIQVGVCRTEGLGEDTDTPMPYELLSKAPPSRKPARRGGDE